MKTSLSLARRTALGAFVVLFCLSLSPASRCAEPDLAEAVSAYENFEYDQALSLLTQLAKRSGLSQAQRAKVHLYTGLTLFTLGNQDKAEQEFRAALEADYEISPPQDTSPKIMAAFEAIKKTVPAPVVSAKPPVTKGSNPPGAPPPEVVRPAPARGRVWTWLAVGVGAAAMAGGGLSAGLAAQAKRDFDSEPMAVKAADIKQTVETRALAANVLFGVGGAALLTGLILFFVEDTGPDGAQAEAAWRIDFGPRGVAATVEF